MTREKLSLDEWRNLIVYLSVFYIFLSILTVLQGVVLTSNQYSIIILIMYAVMYAIVYYSIQHEVYKVYGHVKLLRPEMSPQFTTPLRFKLTMLEVYLAIVVVLFVLEVIAHALVDATSSYFVALLLYEVIQFICVAVIFWLFFPRPVSPFFFMIPARAGDRRTRYVYNFSVLCII